MSSENTSPLLYVRPRSVLASRPHLLRGEDFGFNTWSAAEYDRDTDRRFWFPLEWFHAAVPTPLVAKLRKPTVGLKCQSGRRRRAVALASVRRLRFESLQSLPIHTSTASVRFHLFPGHLQVLPLVHLIH
jgi:hypothetical protein